VWAPDAIGSVLFLVASGIALAPQVRARRHGHARDRSWAIAALNMLGSVFFGLSAIGAYTLPSTDQLLSVSWSNWGTFLGAICFLWGAVLLLPRHGEHADATRSAAAS
jgi:drug/metabolite transporter (DMT)-like permease